jgi:SAM-dependent methyltransferase
LWNEKEKTAMADQSNQINNYYVQTRPGLEEIAWLEIRDMLPYAKFGEYLFAKEQNGVVTFSYKGDMADVNQLLTSEDEFLQALSIPKLSRGRQDLAVIQEAVAKGEEFGRAANQFLRFRQFSRPPSYRVICRKFGTHEYRQSNVEQLVLDAMMTRYPRWQPITDGPQVELWINLLGSQLLCGFRITDKGMKKQHKLRKASPNSLRPSVAAAMVGLTQPNDDDVFLDPFCGDGIMLQERKLFGNYVQLWGANEDISQVSIAEMNLASKKSRRLSPDITLATWVNLKLPLEDESVDKIATNLMEVEMDMGSVFKEIGRVLRPEGTAVILSSEYDKIKDTIRYRPELEIMTGYSVKPASQWGRIYIIKRK